MEQHGEREGLFTGNGYRTQHPESPYTDLTAKRPGWSKLLVLAGITTTFGLSLPVGYNIGVVNTPAFVIKSFCNESVYTRYGSVLSKGELDLLWSFIVSIFLVGAAVGSLGGSVLADKIGRKRVLYVCGVIVVAAAGLFFGSKSANSIEMIILGRLLAGLSGGLTTSVVPMYLAELAPLHLKGAAGALCNLGVTIGVLLGQIISMYSMLGSENYWPHCLAFYSLPVLVSAMFMPILPESPKYTYVIKKQPQVALQHLRKLRNVRDDFLQAEIEELKNEEIDSNKIGGETWNLKRVATDYSLLLPLVLVCSLQAGQQLSGINAVFYYSSNIFRAAGLSIHESELATIGAGIFNFVMAMFSIPIIANINRRTCAQISMITSAFFLIILGIATTYIKSYSWVPYVSIIGVLGYVICYGIGMGPIPYFIGSELFEVAPRASAMALGSMSSWAANFIIGLTFPTMQLWIGPASFFIFAGVVVCLYLLVRFYLPETRGRDAREIAEICSDGFSSRPLEPRIKIPQSLREPQTSEEKV